MRILSVVVVVGLAVSASADEHCVRLAPGTAIASSTKGPVVGTVKEALAAKVEAEGAWLRLSYADLADDGQARTEEGALTFYAPRSAAKRTRCPAPANMGLLEASSAILSLRWKDGSEAGWTHTTSVVGGGKPNREVVEVAGEKQLCFDYEMTPALTAHVCASCKTLADGGVGVLGALPLRCP